MWCVPADLICNPCAREGKDPVLTRLRVVAAVLLCALVTVGLSLNSAEAAGVARVGGLASSGTDWYNARLKAHWKGVSGATYQMRWATSKARLGSARPVAVRTTSGVSSAVNRCVPWYFQVRALRGSVAGAWSAPILIKFLVRRPAVPTFSAVGGTNSVTFNWPYANLAGRYRIRWDAAPFGRFPGSDTYVSPTSGGWVNQYARSATLTLPTVPRAGDRMMGVAYANPVYAQIEANNPCVPAGLPHSTYIPVFPKAPDPGPGDALRIGTYNVELSPTGGARMDTIADIVADNHLQIVALQEASRDTSAALVSRLGSLWAAVPWIAGSDQQIVYRKDNYRLVADGSFLVANAKPGGSALVTPWARFRPLQPSSAQSQDVIVVSLHLTVNPDASAMSKKAAAGAAARQALSGIDAINPGDLPVITAGDFQYLREPFGDVAGYVEAPPTFVRAGYYDAMAAVTKVNYQYTTVNGHASGYQVRSTSGVGTRADYIMLKGFKGSNRYEDVINRFIPGTMTTPSDHNLILADVTVPYAP